jgi:hypothetical protein
MNEIILTLNIDDAKALSSGLLSLSESYYDSWMCCEDEEDSKKYKEKELLFHRLWEEIDKITKEKL